MLTVKPLVEGYAVMQLGTMAMKTFAETRTLIPKAGETFYAVRVLVALVLWGSGRVWLYFALASIARSRFPFNTGWWEFNLCNRCLYFSYQSAWEGDAFKVLLGPCNNTYSSVA